MTRGFRLTLGANVVAEGRTHFRVWAPDRRQVEVLLEDGRALPLARDARGYFEGTHAVDVGARYRYRLDGRDAFPDPCSRFQPDGPHGPSEVVDPARYRWRVGGWRGPEGMRGQVLYELHVGAFTPEGTYAAAAARLPQLRELGVTCVELMPLHTFPGRFNWGYDGAQLFAPCAVYGRPDDLRAFVDAAHALGLSVLLDVVYNHLGPDGNYLGQYARGYFSTKYPGEWGDPTNFDDGEAAGPSRDFFVQNACHWVAEYHVDGLRLDATQSLFDAGPRHIVEELTAAVRAAAGERRVLVIAENEPQDVQAVTPSARGGWGADALWVDDFHHAARVAATGRAEAYLQDYRGSAQELLGCALHNSLFQGQYYRWQKKARGSPLWRAPAEACVFFLQNHDQLANTLKGERLQCITSARLARALTVYWLLLPQTPLLFMGQEWFACTPFLYFVDHTPELMGAVQRGRNAFLSQFESARHALEREGHVVPFGEDAFRRSKLDWEERARVGGPALALHRELLRLRREDPRFARQDARALAGAALSPTALVLRYRAGEAEGPEGGQDGERLVLLNLGPELELSPCPEPLLAPLPGRTWRPILSSEEVKFGGYGACTTEFLRIDDTWRVPGQTALVLTSAPRGAAGPETTPTTGA